MKQRYHAGDYILFINSHHTTWDTTCTKVTYIILSAVVDLVQVAQAQEQGSDFSKRRPPNIPVNTTDSMIVERQRKSETTVRRLGTKQNDRFVRVLEWIFPVI